MEKRSQAYHKGKHRRMTRVYDHWNRLITYHREKMAVAVANHAFHHVDILKVKLAMMERERSKCVAADPMDPRYRRLLYCRYADDFIIGIIGPKAHARTLFEEVKAFLKERLNLNVSEEKSGIVHAGKGIRYLGYDISVADHGRARSRTQKSVNGNTYRSTKTFGAGSMKLRVPPGTAEQYVAQRGYVGPKGTAVARRKLMYRSDEEIVLTYNAELRGLANYYALAVDVKFRLSWAEFMNNGSLMATLAAKHGTSISKVKRMLRAGNELIYRSNRNGKNRQFKVYRLKHLMRGRTVRNPDVIQNTRLWRFSRTEVIDRLNAEKCEYCERTEGRFEVHHIKKIKNTKPKGMIGRLMAERNRKTMVLCAGCHDQLHAGRLPDRRTFQNGVESCVQ